VILVHRAIFLVSWPIFVGKRQGGVMFSTITYIVSLLFSLAIIYVVVKALIWGIGKVWRKYWGDEPFDPFHKGPMG